MKVNLVLQSNLNQDGLDKDEFVLIDKAVEYLGLKESTLYTYTRNKRLRHYKRGGRVYFKKSELNAFIEKGLVEERSSKLK